MLRHFRTYNLAVQFYRLSLNLKLSRQLSDQLKRAASSVALNLAEGSGRNGKDDQLRFFHIAFGSLRECQAILDMAVTEYPEAVHLADTLAANLYRLIHPVKR